jgi:7-cyano-7-deazaguanine synthase in queuosine biosynthesis
MLRELVPEEIAVVALVMDNTPAEIETLIENVGPDLLQFHGGETDAFCAGFGLPFLKAIAMASEDEDASVRAAEFPSAYGYLLDGHAIGAAAAKDDIPVTYVPARNTIMLSIALGWAEVLGANDIFCGVNAVDYSGYPDCRPEFVEAFERLANLATKAGVEGAGLRVQAPLQFMSKADIVREGQRLGVDFSQTVSCYQADDAGRACGHCDACRLRAEGFNAAGVADPTRYV